MRTVWHLTFTVLLALGFAALGRAQPIPPPTMADAAPAVEAATSDKSPTALLIPGNEGLWSLVSDGKDSRVVAKLGWQSLSGSFALGIESSASIQKNSPDTALLNLDGLAGGDASVSGQFSYRKPFRRSRGNLLSICQQVNLAIEQQIREDRGGLFAEPLHGKACTVEALENTGFGLDAIKVELDALDWACGELAKLNPEIVLILPNEPLPGKNAPPKRFGSTGECTDQAFIDAAKGERARREADAKAKAESAKKEQASLLDRIAANDAAFAETSDPTRREKLAQERLELASLIAAQEQIIAQSEGTLDDLPKLLRKPAETLAAKKAELLAALCKRYNEPDRSAEIILTGFAQINRGCELGRIEKSIASLSDPRVRDRLRWDVIDNLPAGIWALTFRGGIDNKGFEFVDPSALPGFTTFEQLEGGVQSETENDSLFGVAWTLQRGANFWRLGYDRKNVHQGGEETDTCIPTAAGSSVQRCVSVILGEPKRVDENVVTAEYRRLVTSRFGISARALYLDETVRKNQPVSNEWEGHLVLYFLTHATNGLNGGLDIAHDSLSNDTTARLFIGQSFNLFE